MPSFGFIKEQSTGAKIGSALKKNFIDNPLQKTLGIDSSGKGSIDLFFKDNEQSSFDFGHKSKFYLDGHPKLKFQYFVKIHFNQLAKLEKDSTPFYKYFLSDDEITMLVPLIKSVDMPGMKIETERLNQYNRWKISQTKIQFEPIKLSMHDTVDGKPLRFWEMYYEYYFKESFHKIDGKKFERKLDTSFSPFSSLIDRSETSNMDYKTFGFNIDHVQNERNLIDLIEIYQYHAGRWNVVTLVKPYITAFKQDSVAYEDSKTSSLDFTFEYEYALYHNFFTPFNEKNAEYILDSEGGKEGGIFGWSNPLGHDVTNVNIDANKDFKVRNRDAKDNSEYQMQEEFGSLQNNSLLGNLMSSAMDILESGPGKIAESAGNALVTGEWESPFDSDAIQKGFQDQVKSSTTTIPSKSFSSAIKGSARYIPRRS